MPDKTKAERIDSGEEPWDYIFRGRTLLVFRDGELLLTLTRNIKWVPGGTHFLARYQKQWRYVKKVGSRTYRLDIEGAEN